MNTEIPTPRTDAVYLLGKHEILKSHDQLEREIIALKATGDELFVRLSKTDSALQAHESHQSKVFEGNTTAIAKWKELQ